MGENESAELQQSVTSVTAQIEAATTALLGTSLTAREFWLDLGAFVSLTNGRRYLFTPSVRDGELEVQVRRLHGDPAGAHTVGNRIDRSDANGIRAPESERQEYVEDWSAPPLIEEAANRIHDVYYGAGIGSLLPEEYRQQLKDDVNYTLLQLRKVIRKSFPRDLPNRDYWPKSFSVELPNALGGLYRIRATRHGRQISLRVLTVEQDGSERPLDTCRLADLATLEGQQRADRFVRDFLHEDELTMVGWNLRWQHLDPALGYPLPEQYHPNIAADSQRAYSRLVAAVKAGLPQHATSSGIPFAFSVPFLSPGGRQYEMTAIRINGPTQFRLFRIHEDGSRLDVGDAGLAKDFSDPKMQVDCDLFSADFFDDHLRGAFAKVIRAHFDSWHAKVLEVGLVRVSLRGNTLAWFARNPKAPGAHLLVKATNQLSVDPDAFAMALSV